MAQTDVFPPGWLEIEAARTAALSATLDLAVEHHGLTRRKMAEAGLARADLESPSDLARLPLTTKAEFAAEPEAARLDLKARTCRRRSASSGT